MKSFLIAVSLLSLSAQVNSMELNKSQISKKLQSITSQSGNGIKVEDVEQSPMPNFFQVLTDKGILYIHKEGEFVFSGSLHDFNAGMANLTSARMKIEHTKKINAIKNDFITYRAPNQQHEIVVFFDTSCGYCHKLHSQIAEYNALGITVHYAAYPRNGIFDQRNPTLHTSAFNELQNIWCAPTEQQTLVFDMVSRGTTLPAKQCDNTIEQQYLLGQAMGVRGTPTIIGLNGETIVPGYMPPKELKTLLDKERSDV